VAKSVVFIPNELTTEDARCSGFDLLRRLLYMKVFYIVLLESLGRRTMTTIHLPAATSAAKCERIIL
jgi:hypothetical protein